jgi:isoleucyl-tRNA synthetase
MSAVLAVVKLGRAARSEANIKVRQPLPAILVHTPDPADAEAVVRLKEQIVDELNVKDVRALTELGDVLAYEVKPNLPLLGPKYGKQLGGIRGALGKMDAADVAAKANAGENVALTLPDGSTIELLPEEVLVGMQKKEGFAAAQSENATVVLDTELTPDLIAEGRARDVVRAIQDLRKQLELNIDDRIAVRYKTVGDLADVIAAHHHWIAAEVLATSLEPVNDLADGTDVTISGETSKVSIIVA